MAGFCFLTFVVIPRVQMGAHDNQSVYQSGGRHTDSQADYPCLTNRVTHAEETIVNEIVCLAPLQILRDQNQSFRFILSTYCSNIVTAFSVQAQALNMHTSSKASRHNVGQHV